MKKQQGVKFPKEWVEAIQGLATPSEWLSQNTAEMHGVEPQ